MSPLLRIGIGLAAASLLMAALWLVQRAKRNAGIVDVAWSFATGLLGVFFALFGSGAEPRRILVAAIAGAWGVRLGVYLFRRVVGEEEDGRYRALREKWGDRAQARLFLFFQAQAIFAVTFALPMLLAAENPAPALAWYDFAGAALFVLALLGESIADRQLARFRADPSTRGRVCRDGLWAFSRHPNYFFEWLHWFAYVLIGFSGPSGWLTLFGPAVMLFFLLRVTGIPPTEARAVASRGEAYRKYQREVSVFFPLPPAKGVSS